MQYMKTEAEKRSGVNSVEAHDVTHLYEKVGEPAFRELSKRFYDKVYADEEWFQAIFKGKDKDSAIQNQCEFFMQRMGGPSLYTDRKGNHTLISRHKGWRVDPPAADRWLLLMQQSLDEVESIDKESKEQMHKFFKYTAHLLVASKEVMQKKKEEQPSEVLPSGKDIILQGPN
mmetsp:Transcript_16440/g.41548  ORF Transcript_16440/g.41548 Transcript_16440/m.41548 type:complete len:173 (+) Transcript_16440:245-763(+)